MEPRFISFDGESLLNALLYGPDEFNDKINEEIILRIIPNTADNTGLAEEGHAPPLFYVAKIKKGNKEKERKSFKVETIKRLSPRSKCYCFSNVYCFILERLEIKFFSVFHDPSTLKSISLALPNLALICKALHQKLISLRCTLGGIVLYVLLLVMT